MSLSREELAELVKRRLVFGGALVRARWERAPADDVALEGGKLEAWRMVEVVPSPRHPRWDPEHPMARRCARCGHRRGEHRFSLRAGEAPGCSWQRQKQRTGHYEACICPGFTEATG